MRRLGAPGRGGRRPNEGTRARTLKQGGPLGRTVVGSAAAVVAAALAVAVAGQVPDGGGPGDRRAAAGSVRPTRSPGAQPQEQHAPPAVRAEEDAEPPSLHAQLKGRFPLPEHLALSGRFVTVGGRDVPPPGKGPVIRYRVDVEEGLPLDGALFAKLVQETLNDPRSWGHGGELTFERVPSGPVDWVIAMASPGTTDAWCALSDLDTSIDNVSCDSANTDRVMINAYRWAQGAGTYGDDLLGYRRILINHEVGHRLGYGHQECPENGAPAPVMMQQTKFLTTKGRTCQRNPWPHPRRSRR